MFVRYSVILPVAVCGLLQILEHHIYQNVFLIVLVDGEPSGFVMKKKKVVVFMVLRLFRVIKNQRVGDMDNGLDIGVQIDRTN